MEKKQDELEKQKSKAMKAVENLIDQVAESEEEIGKLKNQISNLEEQITSKKDDIEHKEEEYNEQEKLLDKRLIAIYKNGETSYLDLLLSSNNMSDFLARYYSASELIECDKDLIATIKEQKAQIEAEKTELENNKIQLNTSLEEQKKEKCRIRKITKRKTKLCKSAYRRRKRTSKRN